MLDIKTACYILRHMSDYTTEEVDAAYHELSSWGFSQDDIEAVESNFVDR